MNTFAEFKKFDNKEEAEALAERLLGLGIMTEIEDNTSSVNSTFTGAAASTEVVVKIMQSDFEKANKLMEEEAAKLVNEEEIKQKAIQAVEQNGI